MDQVTAKPRVATIWLGGCSGCHMSFLDLDEGLLALAEQVELCYSPILDVKEFPHGVDVTLVEGAVVNEDNLRQIRKVRERTRILVAFGDCSITGNVPALRNLTTVQNALDRAYDANTMPKVGVPAGDDIVPRLLPRVLRVHDVVKVDRFLPGCPPSAERIKMFLLDLLEGREPAFDDRSLDARFGA